MNIKNEYKVIETFEQFKSWWLSEIELMNKVSYCKTALFDADGTLWRGDITDVAIDDYLEHHWLSTHAQNAVNDIMDYYKIDKSRNFYDDISTVMKLFNEKMLYPIAYELKNENPSDVIKRIYSWQSQLFCGLSPDFLKSKGRQLVEKYNNKLKMIPIMQQIVSFFKSAGIKIIILSASNNYLIEGGLEANGFEFDYLRGMEVEVKDDIMTMNLKEPLIFGCGKVKAYFEFCKNTPVIAFGDAVSTTDKEMLELSLLKVAANPKGRHLIYSKDNGYSIIITR